MDTKFSVALHILTMISESKDTLSSQALAESVGTNASYIRKVIALLKNAGLITSHQGKTGYQLSKSPKEVTLLQSSLIAMSCWYRLFVPLAIYQSV